MQGQGMQRNILRDWEANHKMSRMRSEIKKILGCRNLQKAKTKKECEAAIMKTKLDGNKQYKWIFKTSGFPIIHPDDNLKDSTCK